MKISLFVNTTDTFEDCWIPFFRLFEKYWSDYKGTIYLNTEQKDFSYNGLNIKSIRNKALNKPWSNCLKTGLEKVPDEIVLYMQEDYFLKDKVNSKKLDYIYALFKTKNFDCIQLTDQSTKGPFIPTSNDNIVEISSEAEYFVSTQAAFWKKDVLLSLLKENETGWEFEKNASKRANKFGYRFYNVNGKKYVLNETEIIPYVFTGIIKGKWKKEVKKLFENNNISVDFQKRGFYKRSRLNLIRKFIK